MLLEYTIMGQTADFTAINLAAINALHIKCKLVVHCVFRLSLIIESLVEEKNVAEKVVHTT